MAEIILYILVIIAGGGMLLAGFFALGYGMYALAIPGFDKNIRNFSLIGGTGLIAVVFAAYFAFSLNNNDSTFSGTYLLKNNPALKMELKKDGSFVASPELFVKTNGKWNLIEAEDYKAIDILTTDNFRLKTLIIREEKTKHAFQLILTSGNQFENVENQLVFIKAQTTQK